jgi:hypothetical protein
MNGIERRAQDSCLDRALGGLLLKHVDVKERIRNKRISSFDETASEMNIAHRKEP